MYRQRIAAAVFIETGQKRIFVGVFQNQFGIHASSKLARQTGFAGANRPFDNDMAETAEHVMRVSECGGGLLAASRTLRFCRQARDVAAVDSSKAISYPTMARNKCVWRNFRQWYQDESTLHHARVRQGQAVFMHDQAIVEQQIEIEAARRVLESAVAAVPGFYAKQGSEQGARGQLGAYASYCIDEVRLIGIADRFREIQRAACDQAGFRQIAEFGPGLLDLNDRVAEIGAESDVSGNSGRSRARSGDVSQA